MVGAVRVLHIAFCYGLWAIAQFAQAFSDDVAVIVIDKLEDTPNLNYVCTL